MQPPPLVEAILIVVAIAAWLVGAYGMVGYARWFFASEHARAVQDRADALEKENR